MELSIALDEGFIFLDQTNIWRHGVAQQILWISKRHNLRNINWIKKLYENNYRGEFTGKRKIFGKIWLKVEKSHKFI